jgi:hypothetical protein
MNDEIKQVKTSANKYFVDELFFHFIYITKTIFERKKNEEVYFY